MIDIFVQRICFLELYGKEGTIEQLLKLFVQEVTIKLNEDS